MATVDASKDIVILGIFGRNVILTSAGLLTTSVLYGVYLIVFFAAMSIMCRRTYSFTGPRIALLAAVIILFILSTSYICCSFSYFILGVEKLLVENPGTVPLLVKNAGLLAKHRSLGVIGEITFPIASVVGDSIVIWRAWVLSGGNKKVMILPVLLLLGTTGTAFSWVGCMVKEHMPVSFSAECKNRNTATFILSMVTNVAGTVVIGYQTWLYRRSFKQYMNNHERQGRAEKIMVMLLESGIVYTTFWIIMMSVLVAPNTPDYTNQAFRIVFSASATQLVGIYPTLMVVLVFLRRSLWDVAGNSTVYEDTDMKFAPNGKDKDTMTNNMPVSTYNKSEMGL
ncbi:hypothetical protein E1B28_009536 [Marasmius oreades]|uniref:Uncharacterized protein n=1 Tax=Marasmius oreades TaxID=181124 RepID=A0A9P7RVF8_9AGAR|nr:uncharacterized protein E1B28_009536 [Marasmius oreades]KAG7090417.1 hypothetical protein E1B28_009536 [Marasmius oreades]